MKYPGYEHGQSLKALLKQQKTLDEDQLLGLFLPIIDGLEKVHQQGFIHRDIKPDNIYVREDGSPVLLDFGSARQPMGGSKTMTSLVTPGYAPFEQYYEKGEEQGPWTDIYGLGATLYRAVTGKKPMDAVYRSRALIEDNQEPLESASKLGQGRYSTRLLQAIDHAIQFRPSERPQSLAEWRNELQPNGASDELNDFNANQITTQVAAVKQESGKESEKKANSTGKPQRPKRLLSFLMVALVLVIGGFALFEWQRQASHSARDTANETTATETNQQALEQTLAAEKLAQQRLLEEARTKAEAERIAAEKLREKQIQEQQLREEQQRLLEQKRLEEQRIAEEQQRREEEKQRREQQRLAEAKRKAAIEQKIAASKPLFTARLAKKLDIFSYNDSRRAVSLSSINNSIQVAVPAASQAWQSAGALIERGKTYRIIATGQWKMGRLCNSSDASGQGMYTLACWDGGKQTVDGYPHGALIGKIGKETLPFYVGRQFEFTSDREGPLYLMSNDAPVFIRDNSGELNITIEQLGD